ncbi:acidic fibroblast growth factor intracellular-binding protein [Thecamonas trahens ATCC 50062]|uniref:Acidic fibroblast growth factor intracellular-binding protein n=1 Tax=Thecamonas trahens ATCC 50062 TaxID=461836 RepID=A0A0L0DT45_THETB|nr:acidic fibroblast growth factor intracellular-binding protein [Thecamonas trahens ATCC 50062]KNC55435.1 acidic fibroblast growth factor intracellular-binding protein [Thecamonas trahens ATCC 50062]|eukprot:XP_013752972.1 acidic fibroblast growth factor intracellular-binding protein [Thecamonas trahens ATCC 50062]
MSQINTAFVLDACVVDVPVLDRAVFRQWLAGRSVAEATNARMEELRVNAQTGRGFVLADVRDQFRSFKVLQPYLAKPQHLAMQMMLTVSVADTRWLLEEYYSFDGPVFREVVGKKLSSKTRRDLDDVAERSHVELVSCQRQFDNLRTIFITCEQFLQHAAENSDKPFVLAHSYTVGDLRRAPHVHSESNTPLGSPSSPLHTRSLGNAAQFDAAVASRTSSWASRGSPSPTAAAAVDAFGPPTQRASAGDLAHRPLSGEMGPPPPHTTRSAGASQNNSLELLQLPQYGGGGAGDDGGSSGRVTPDAAEPSPAMAGTDGTSWQLAFAPGTSLNAVVATTFVIPPSLADRYVRALVIVGNRIEVSKKRLAFLRYGDLDAVAAIIAEQWIQPSASSSSSGMQTWRLDARFADALRDVKSLLQDREVLDTYRRLALSRLATSPGFSDQVLAAIKAKLKELLRSLISIGGGLCQPKEFRDVLLDLFDGPVELFAAASVSVDQVHHVFTVLQQTFSGLDELQVRNRRSFLMPWRRYLAGARDITTFLLRRYPTS